MQGANRVNDEFEVGFDQEFERKWYYAELGGRVVMLLFVACALAGLLGRGPFSHRRVYAEGGGLSVDYEPVARHNTATTVTLHVPNETAQPRPVVVSVSQAMIEPMGLQGTVPLAESASVSRDGMSLHFIVAPNQPDALIRLQLQPTALGEVQLTADANGARAVWSAFVVP